MNRKDDILKELEALDEADIFKMLDEAVRIIGRAGNDVGMMAYAHTIALCALTRAVIAVGGTIADAIDRHGGNNG